MKGPADQATHPDQRHQTGPFDVIGDVHGCHDELVDLLGRLDYQVSDAGRVTARHGRRVVFLGDLVDRGPKVVPVLRLVMGMVCDGVALCIEGNHEHQMMTWFDQPDSLVAWGLDRTIEELRGEPEDFWDQVREFCASLPGHMVLDGGRLVVAHAGLPEELHGDPGYAARRFSRYGSLPGDKDRSGLPLRRDWVSTYDGSARVVFGHTPTRDPEWVRQTLCVDTGCVYGGSLTALRYPEYELLSVPARATYYDLESRS